MLINTINFSSTKLNKSEDNERIIALWCCRLFEYPEFIKKTKTNQNKSRMKGFDLEIFFEIIGLEAETSNIDDLEYRLVKQSIQNIKKNLNRYNNTFTGPLSLNLEKIGLTLNLNQTEQTILGFFALIEHNNKFEDIVSAIGELSTQSLYKLLSHLLDTTETEIMSALKKTSSLYKTGLLKVDNNLEPIQRKVDLLNGICGALFTSNQDMLGLLKDYFQQTQPSKLKASNFPHLKADTKTVIEYLKNNKSSGINILVHGKPGTGKSQWVKTIAEELKMELFEISSENDDGDSLRPENRISAYKLAQATLEHLGGSRKPIIVFDEIEDTFPSTLSFSRNERISKAWLNKVLEENPVPSFWISNSINQIDNAYIRRFDLVIEVEAPPKSIRKKIINEYLTYINVSKKWIDELSKHEIVPALIERTAKVVKKTSSKQSTIETEQLFMRILNKNLEAQGKKAIKIKHTNKKIPYHLEYINTDCDLKQLVGGLKKSQTGRFCLYGIPGTGKTAFGHYLAEALNKPIILKKASDLLSPYVGVAEMNIASAFKEAEIENAILQIDEADSFLQNRDRANANWEVTQVNELLTQMESFEGIFIASTNLLNNIDSAAMRRFDLKLEFKALSFEQSWKMLTMQTNTKKIEPEKLADIKGRLENLHHLTPGDFSAAVRKMEISGFEMTAEALVHNLEVEHSFKPQHKKSNGIGFMSSI